MTHSLFDPDGEPDLAPDRYLNGKLNRHARRILLLAPGPEAEPAIIPPVDSKPSTAVSHQQALRRLEERGLVSTEVVQIWITIKRDKSEFEWNQVLGEWVKRRVPSQQRRRKLAVRLTPSGAAVVGEMRGIWESEPASAP